MQNVSGANSGSVSVAVHMLGTANSVEDETRNARRNAKQNPEWSSRVSFQTAYLKRDMNFDNRGFRLAFQRAFRVSSSTERAVRSCKMHLHSHSCVSTGTGLPYTLYRPKCKIFEGQVVKKNAHSSASVVF